MRPSVVLRSQIKTMKKYGISLLILLFSFTASYSQKYGYVNAGNIIEAITTQEGSDKALENYQAPLLEKGQKMMEKFKANEQALYQDMEAGTLSRIAIQERQNALVEEQKSIGTYEQEVVNNIKIKREEILAPILTRVQTAIDEIAKSEGYTIIFDSSMMNAILFTTPDGDIEAKVRAKLGI